MSVFTMKCDLKKIVSVVKCDILTKFIKIKHK